MRERTNPLDEIKIASPCGANWDEMYGSQKKRFCAECRLNVYNVSEMTKEEAENFILRSEGRLCLRIYQRRDGTVITRDCPVGWARVKRRVSRVSAAALSLLGGFLSGLLGIASLRALDDLTTAKEPQPATSEKWEPTYLQEKDVISFGGDVSENDLANIKVAILTSRF